MLLKKTLGVVLKWISYIFLFLILVVLGVQVYLVFFAEDFVEKKLKDLVFEQSDGLYTLDFNDFDLYVFNRGVTVKNLHLRPDTAKIDSLAKYSNKDVSLFNIKVDKIKISGVHFWQLFRNKKLIINKFYVSTPIIEKIKHKDIQEKETNDELVPDFYSMIKKELKEVEVKKVIFTDGNFISTNMAEKKPETFEFSLIDISVDDFIIDSSFSERRQKLKFASKFMTTIGKFSTTLADSFYIFKAGPIKVESSSDTISIDSLQMLPTYSFYEFAQKKGHEIDRFNIRYGKSKILNFSYTDFFYNNKIKSEKLTFSDFNVEIFRDKRLPFPQNNRPKMPHELLREMSTNINLDTIHLIRWNISYSEQVEDGDQPGTVKFKDLFASVYNVTNDSTSLAKEPIMKMDVKTKLMGEGFLTAHFEFPVLSKSNSFTFNGSLDEMPIKAVNSILENTSFVKIENGLINNLKFSVQANNDVATGEMTFLYEDLKVSVVQKESRDKKGLESFLANLLVIKTNNPSGNTVRTGRMYFERDKTRSIINYWWKTVLSGLKESIGLEDAEKTKVSKRDKKFKLRLFRKKESQT